MMIEGLFSCANVVTGVPQWCQQWGFIIFHQQATKAGRCSIGQLKVPSVNMARRKIVDLQMMFLSKEWCSGARTDYPRGSFGRELEDEPGSGCCNDQWGCLKCATWWSTSVNLRLWAVRDLWLWLRIYQNSDEKCHDWSIPILW